MDLTSLVGNVALVCTIASYFAGLPLCVNFYKNKSTGKVSALPFIAGLVCLSSWLVYSIILDNPLLKAVNVAGCTFQTLYLTCFYYFTFDKSILHKQVFTAATFLSVSLYYCINMVDDVQAIRNSVGMLATTTSLAAYIAPMASIKEVLKSKSAETLPFPIILSTFIVTSLWFLYGFLIGDKFVQVPNLIGSVLCGLQLTLFIIYPSKAKTQ